MISLKKRLNDLKKEEEELEQKIKEEEELKQKIKEEEELEQKIKEEELRQKIKEELKLKEELKIHEQNTFIGDMESLLEKQSSYFIDEHIQIDNNDLLKINNKLFIIILDVLKKQQNQIDDLKKKSKPTQIKTVKNVIQLKEKSNLVKSDIDKYNIQLNSLKQWCNKISQFQGPIYLLDKINNCYYQFKMKSIKQYDLNNHYENFHNVLIRNNNLVFGDVNNKIYISTKNDFEKCKIEKIQNSIKTMINDNKFIRVEL